MQDTIFQYKIIDYNRKSRKKTIQTEFWKKTRQEYHRRDKTRPEQESP